jgi:hypothetical protein
MHFFAYFLFRFDSHQVYSALEHDILHEEITLGAPLMRFAVSVFLAVFGLASFSAAAHADTLSNFSFSGQSLYYGSVYPYTTTPDFNVVTGSAVIDTTTGLVQSLQLYATGQSTSGVAYQSGSTIITAVNASYLIFGVSDLIGYTGSSFTLNGPNDNYAGTATMVAVAPEPGTFVLLGSAMLGLIAVGRRRFVHA